MTKAGFGRKIMDKTSRKTCPCLTILREIFIQTQAHSKALGAKS